MKLIKPGIYDVPEIKKLIDSYASSGKMLSHSLSTLYENLRDFHIIKNDNQFAGCVALHIVWDNLAEIRSLAIKNEFQGKGLGKKLIKKCLDEAKELGVNTVFTLTLEPDFFKRFGFKIVNKDSLPHKIWAECVKCTKFPDCDETALEYKFDGLK